jgi:hypothetical protein
MVIVMVVLVGVVGRIILGGQGTSSSSSSSTCGCRLWRSGLGPRRRMGMMISRLLREANGGCLCLGRGGRWGLRRVDLLVCWVGWVGELMGLLSVFNLGAHTWIQTVHVLYLPSLYFNKRKRMMRERNNHCQTTQTFQCTGIILLYLPCLSNYPPN